MFLNFAVRRTFAVWQDPGCFNAWSTSGVSAAMGIVASQNLKTSANSSGNSGTFFHCKSVFPTPATASVEVPDGCELVLPHLFGLLTPP